MGNLVTATENKLNQELNFDFELQFFAKMLLLSPSEVAKGQGQMIKGRGKCSEVRVLQIL